MTFPHQTLIKRMWQTIGSITTPNACAIQNAILGVGGIDKIFDDIEKHIDQHVTDLIGAQPPTPKSFPITEVRLGRDPGLLAKTSAFVIKQAVGPAMYYTGSVVWASNSAEAIFFAREKDAARLIQHIYWPKCVVEEVVL